MSRQNASSGFSLIEVIVTLTLMSALTVMLSSSWWLLARLNTRLETKADSADTLQDKLRIQRFLESIVSVSFVPDTPELELITRPDITRLTAWTSPGGFNVFGAETDPCQLTLETDAGGGLTLKLQPEFFSEAIASTNDAEFAWHSHSTQGRCRIDVLGQDGQWHANWPRPTQRGLPVSIRLRFEDTAPESDILARVHAAEVCYP